MIPSSHPNSLLHSPTSPRINQAYRRRVDGASRWMIESLGESYQIEGHSGCVNTISFNRDGSRLLSGSDDKSLRLWNTKLRRCEIRLGGHISNIFCSGFLPAGNDEKLLSGSNDADVRFYDLIGNMCTVYSYHQKKVLGMTTSQEYPHSFWTCSADGTVRFFDTRQNYSNKKIERLRCESLPNGGFTESSSLRTGSSSSSLRNSTFDDDESLGDSDENDLTAGGYVLPQAYGGGRIDSSSSSSSSHRENATTEEKSSLLLNYSLSHLGSLHGSSVRTLFSIDSNPANGNMFIVSSGEGSVKLFDMRKIDPNPDDCFVNLYSNVDFSRPHNFEATGCAFSHNGHRIVSTFLSDDIYVFDTEQNFYSEFGVRYFGMPRSRRENTSSLSSSVPDRGSAQSYPISSISFSLSSPQAPSPLESSSGVPLISYEDSNAMFCQSDADEVTNTLCCPSVSSTREQVEDSEARESPHVDDEDNHEDGDFDRNLPEGSYGVDEEAFHEEFEDQEVDLSHRINLNDINPSDIADLLNESGLPPTRTNIFRLILFLQTISAARASGIRIGENDVEHSADADSGGQSRTFSLTESTSSDSDDQDDNEEDRRIWRGTLAEGQNTFFRQYKGHTSVRTIKGCNFFGQRSEYVISGSDDARVFIWDVESAELVNVLEGHDSVVNCVQGHPLDPLLATSGIDNVIKIWEPDAFFRRSREEQTEFIRNVISENASSHGRNVDSACTIQ